MTLPDFERMLLAQMKFQAQVFENATFGPNKTNVKDELAEQRSTVTCDRGCPDATPLQEAG